MDIVVLTAALFLSMILLFMLGLPVAFSLAGIGILFGLILYGPSSLSFSAFGTLDVTTSFVLVAAPSFILMGNVLQRSGMADDLFGAVHKWTGGLGGGLAIATVWVCAALGAMIGTAGASIATMGLLALPAMSRRKYSDGLALGTIAAGGAMAALIPPSVAMMLYAVVGRESVGKLFLGGVIPGLIFAALFTVFVYVRCRLDPEAGPALPPVSWSERVVALKGVILPVLLILAALGSIFFGLATPTEAAAIGAAGSFICAAIYRRFDWPMVRDSVYSTARLYGMITWILIGASVFTHFYTSMGAAALVQEAVKGLGIGPWGVVILMQIILFGLGFILDDYAIIMIAAPIFVPIVVGLGFDPLWFGIIFIMNMQMALLTPPYGFALFYIRGLVQEAHKRQLIPQPITVGTIYRSVIPFVAMQAIGIAAVNAFPQLALWLPNQMIR